MFPATFPVSISLFPHIKRNTTRFDYPNKAFLDITLLLPPFYGLSHHLYSSLGTPALDFQSKYL